jgi:hydroxylamine reductase (hybrid-cluster protein)
MIMQHDIIHHSSFQTLQHGLVPKIPSITGNMDIKAMELLDRTNTSFYGNPEITKVNIGVGNKPGILISGHDLHDIEDLLKQTEGRH